MIMTQNKAQKAAIRQRMAETGEPYSVARHAVQDPQPATTEDWDEQYYADGAASEGMTVAEFKAREAADQERSGRPAVDALAASLTAMPQLRDAARAGRRLAHEFRQQLRGGAPGGPGARPRPLPPMPPMPPGPAPGFPWASRRSSRPGPVPLTEDQARDPGPFLEAAREAADKTREAAARAREWADRAQEQADQEQDRADQEQERAILVDEWAGQEEQEGSDEAQERADQAEERADQAEERADEAQEWADRAQEWPAV
jgi:hypothetical protein